MLNNIIQAQKKYIKSDNPLLELKEKIIRGDKGDGIPNIFSPSDCFVSDLRQKPITKGVLRNLWKNIMVNGKICLQRRFWSNKY
jgi:hypothetical protein